MRAPYSRDYVQLHRNGVVPARRRLTRHDTPSTALYLLAPVLGVLALAVGTVGLVTLTNIFAHLIKALVRHLGGSAL